MQESLLNKISNIQQEQKVNIEELEVILNSDIEEIVTLCKKAYLKPKTDNTGHAYFTSEDVNVLRKMKTLYKQSQEVQKKTGEENKLKNTANGNFSLCNPENKINFLTKAKNRIKESSFPSAVPSFSSYQMKNALDNLENNLVSKMSEILSEKMDGFDEIIVELIRSKTENENLRQQVNTLNKQLFILKKELSSYTPLALNLYMKKDTD